MARYALLKDPRRPGLQVIHEAPFDLELDLQELFKTHPELIPAEDFGLTPPLLVVGRETPLPSGKVDLICVDPLGNVVLAEMKRGTEIAESRRVLAQMLDYGADLWGMTPEEFEAQVVLRYFAGPYYTSSSRPACLEEAAAAAWGWPQSPDDIEEGTSHDAYRTFIQGLEHQLDSGEFLYLAVDTHLPAPLQRTLEYVSQTSQFRVGAVVVQRFHEAEMGISIYVPQSFVFMASRRPAAVPVPVDFGTWLENVGTETAREFFRSLVSALESGPGSARFTEAGYFGYRVEYEIDGARRTLGLMDTYSAGQKMGMGQGFLGGRDVLRLGYDQTTPDLLKEALASLVEELPSLGQGSWTSAKMARWWSIELGQHVPNPQEVANWLLRAAEVASNFKG